MLGDNIKRIRRERGFTQEELAIRLHVVRQTVSKWEKNLSVPDAELLQRIGQELDVSVTELLGGEPEQDASRSEIVEQLSRINEQLAVRNRRARRIWTAVAVLLALMILLPMLGAVLFRAAPGRAFTESVTLTDGSPFTEEDTREMFAAVQTFFRSECRACTLEELSYTETAQPQSDETASVEVRFRTGEHPKADGLEPNRAYERLLLLSRADTGAWEVTGWGEG